MKTRDSHAYAAKVWMTQALKAALQDEVRARIEALLPSGYHWTVRHVEAPNESGLMTSGWRASFGDEPGSTHWGLPHIFRTEGAALLGLLAVMVDGCVFPDCATAFDVARTTTGREAEEPAPRRRARK